MSHLLVTELRYRATVQDLGRPGYAHLGVPPAGAADRALLRHANRLVGNDDKAAAIELVLGGFTLDCSDDVDVSVVGAAWSRDGATVTVGATEGVYAYVAVAGGIDVPVVLGSRSTDTLSGLGPAPLRVGDVLQVGNAITGRRETSLHRSDAPLQVVLGPRDDWFADGAVHQLLTTDWAVTPSSDRVGLRLAGPVLQRRTENELLSEGVIPGAIQVPSDGQPIVFLANAPTTGGYPIIAVVISADVDRAAQMRPGAVIRFSHADSE